MIKKAVLATTFLVVAPAILWVVDPGGHVSTITGYFGEWFKPSLDYEMNRAQTLVDKLDKTIKVNRETLAREEVLLDKLAENIKKQESVVEARRSRLVALRDQLRSGEQTVSIDNRTEQDLSRRLSQLKIAQRKSDGLSRNFEIRQKRFEALREKVGEMVSAKSDMEDKLETLKAELEAVRVEEVHAKFSVDDSDFARANALLDEIDTEVRTRKKLLEMETDVIEKYPVDAPISGENLLEEVDAYLDGKGAPKVAGK